MPPRGGCCQKILYWLVAVRLYIADELNPGPLEEVEEMAELVGRRCQNSKSRAHPDVQCPLGATYGEYCYRHYKNPRRFVVARIGAGKEGWAEPVEATEAAARIQRAWQRAAPRIRWRGQGPAANARDLANNDTELYSFDPLSSIPQAYFFSFADERRAIWAFDIRTLAHSMGTGFQSMNPYTRDTLSAGVVARLQARVAWLRARGFQIQHITTDVLTPEQLWNQRVLDVFLKIEALGYYANADWFHALPQLHLMVLYKRLGALWEWRLGLSPLQREAIVPGHADPGERRLFKFVAEDHFEKPRGWWARQLIAVAEAFVGRATEAEQRKLGAMYVLMGLVQVSRPAAVALPWVLEMVT